MTDEKQEYEEWLKGLRAESKVILATRNFHSWSYWLTEVDYITKGGKIRVCTYLFTADGKQYGKKTDDLYAKLINPNSKEGKKINNEMLKQKVLNLMNRVRRGYFTNEQLQGIIDIIEGNDGNG